MPSSPHRATRSRAGATFTAVAALAALATLTGCATAGPAPHVTITVPPSAPASDSTPPEPTPPPDSGDTGIDSGGSGLTLDTSIIVTQGAVAPACTHSVCHFVHVVWSDIDPGWHSVECVSDEPSVGAWSTGNYDFATRSGEQDIGCFLAYDGSKVWVIIDDTIESSHGHWG